MTLINAIYVVKACFTFCHYIRAISCHAMLTFQIKRWEIQ